MSVIQDRYEWMLELLSELFEQPYYSGFAFIEIITMIYVWLELWYSPVQCSNTIRLSQVYFPLLMTLLDISKYNVYISMQHIRQKQVTAAVTSFFNMYFLISYFILTILLGCLYGYTILMDIYKICVYMLCKCNLCTYNSTTSASNNDKHRMDSVDRLLDKSSIDIYNHTSTSTNNLMNTNYNRKDGSDVSIVHLKYSIIDNESIKEEVEEQEEVVVL